MDNLDNILDSLVIDNGNATYAYQYYSLLKERTIYFNEDIDAPLLDSVAIPLMRFDDGTNRPVKLIFNTKGGDPFTALPTCDIIDNIGVPLKIVVPAFAFSAGIYLLCAGASNPFVKRYCYPHTLSLLHGGQTNLSGSSSSVKDTQAFVERYDAEINEYILSHTSLPADIVRDAERKEIYLTARDMLKYGIVDEIIQPAGDGTVAN